MNGSSAVLHISLPAINYAPLIPVIVLTVTGLLALLLDAALPKRQHLTIAWISIAGLAVAFVDCVTLINGNQSAFNGTFVADNFALFFNMLLLFAAALTILMSIQYAGPEPLNEGDYYALIVLSTVGMLLVAQAADLVILFIGIETLSIALYVLAGYTKSRLVSEEAALKYFLLGAFAFGFLLYGIAFIFGATGATNYAAVAQGLSGSESPTLLHLAFVGMGLLLVGFGFKLSFVPFHNWTPDVYDGAPTPVTAFMSVATKVAMFAGLLRVLQDALAPLTTEWFSVLWALAVLTMIVGNLIAIAQTRIKRMLAYSSIAQAGYVLLGTLAGSHAGQSATMFYLAVYSLMNLGAFAVVVALDRNGREVTDLEDFRGLASRQPALAALMAVFMLSLAGIPPTAGFIGKLYLFLAIIQAGHAELAIIGVITTAISGFYYLRLVVLMFFTTSPEERPVEARVSTPLGVLLTVAVVGTLLLGIVPSVVVPLAQGSAIALTLP
ncbi:MAG: NADH-quinone oxidoreductase subunit N [Chloroflexi bacterium]|nr:NADH-quinone oxidoreductase subunit N [Chloroflexota bacterium]